MTDEKQSLCAWCGETFMLKQTRGNPQRYCGEPCREAKRRSYYAEHRERLRAQQAMAVFGSPRSTAPKGS